MNFHTSTPVEENEFSVVSAQRHKILSDIAELFSIAKSLPRGGCPISGCAISETTNLRRLLPSEIQTLQKDCGCHSKDWSRIYLALSRESEENDQSEFFQEVISDTRFDGTIVLDMTDDSFYQDDESRHNGPSDYHKLPPGIHSNLMISDSILRFKSCRVYRNSFITNTFVGSNAILVQCGCISVDDDALPYGRLTVSVGPESGGNRELALLAEHTMIDVCRQLRHGPSSLSTLPMAAAAPMNVIGSHCVVRDTPTLTCIFLHERSSIQGATEVRQATLFPKASIRGSCVVSKVLLQWDCSIVSNSSVSDALLMEQSHVGPNSIVISTVLGPDVHVSAGEVHASVLGSNTNAHHQSLLIGILWPLGRGNVGYGANVGSNHTGRMPDQEASVGEGIFWGLSNVIKFPVDLSFAPYSIVAAGTTLPPQRICMPFSLIVDNGNGGNDIIPGWVLQSSPYTLLRSDKKYATRRKAKRHDHYTGWRIFRPETMAMCRWAKMMLESGSHAHGVGACSLSARARDSGIKAYTECLQRYSLHGLLQWILQTTDSGKISLDVGIVDCELGDVVSLIPELNIDPLSQVEWPTFPWEVKGASEWQFQKSLLLELFPLSQKVSLWLEDVLLLLVLLEKDMARRVRGSKQRDDTRGANTIPGYAKAHVSADKDPVTVEADVYAAHIASAVADVLTMTGSRSRM